VACLAEPDYGCNRADFCPTLGFWKGLHEAVDKYVDGTSLQHLIKNKGPAKRSK